TRTFWASRQWLPTASASREAAACGMFSSVSDASIRAPLEVRRHPLKRKCELQRDPKTGEAIMVEHQDVVRDQDPLWRHLVGIPVEEQDRLRALEMRARNPLRRVDHIGLGCRDAETTRHFYEDILGMPMVMAVVLPDPYAGGSNQEYCHFFFEIGN